MPACLPQKTARVLNPTDMCGKEMQAMEYNPEAFARVVMLYVDCEVNGSPIKAFVDSGAQSTIMSQPTAQRLGLMRLIDYRLSPPYHLLLIFIRIYIYIYIYIYICICICIYIYIYIYEVSHRSQYMIFS
jgi:hypothetical protein